MLWARHRAKRGREANNQQCTRKMHKKQPPANAHASAMHCHTPATVAAESVQQESAARGKSHQSCQAVREEEREGGGTKRVGVASEMNMREMLVSADSPTLHRSHGAHTQSKQARGVGM